MIPGLCKDKNPGQGVQPWSAGDIYPLVICRVERRVPSGLPASLAAASFAEGRPPMKFWNILNAGEGFEGYASYDDAYEAAKGVLMAREATRCKAIAEGFVDSLSSGKARGVFRDEARRYSEGV